MTRIEVQGTSADSQYEIQCTPDPRNEPWLPIYPHGSGWSGFDGGTVWFDVSTDFRPIASLTNLFYRAVLLPPDLRP